MIRIKQVSSKENTVEYVKSGDLDILSDSQLESLAISIRHEQESRAIQKWVKKVY